MDWSDGANAVKAVSVPVIAMMISALVVYAVAAWVRVISGRSLEGEEK